MKLVECIPNFSEGRRPEVVEAIEAAILSADGVQILDRHSDEDHNRTVITFVAPPEAASTAAFAGIAKAAELIDLESHTGEHPRIGATDVVPFVPLRAMSMDDCVDLARRLGERVSAELNIPVYLYEAAATRPDRENLANIRRGEFEGLKTAIAEDADKAPDFGPRQLGSAGATVIGARKPLIAYNVYLTTDDVDIAKLIAKNVRHSGGGLRFVKALGLLVEGRAQVSMNLTDYSRTPIHHAVELIRREAERYGAAIHHSELVGLTPQQALVDAAQWYLQLDGLESEQIIENHLLGSSDSVSFLDELAEGTPTPGGGSAAAYAGAMAAAMVAMVGRLTVGKGKYAEVEDQAKGIVARADELRSIFEVSVSEDAQAFEGVLAAMRMPRDNGEQKSARAKALEQATIRAGEVPLAVAHLSSEVLELAADIAAIGNTNALSDAGVAANLAEAAFRGAALNVKVNAAGLKNSDPGLAWLEELASIEGNLKRAHDGLRQSLEERAGLED